MTLTIRIHAIGPSGGDTGKPVETVSIHGDNWQEVCCYQKDCVLDNVPALPGRVVTVQQVRWTGKDCVLVVHERVA